MIENTNNADWRLWEKPEKGFEILKHTVGTLDAGACCRAPLILLRGSLDRSGGLLNIKLPFDAVQTDPRASQSNSRHQTCLLFGRTSFEYNQQS
jgi:hypothetical protein